jgi:hypothetical protein
MLDSGGDTTFFIPRGDDDAEKLEWSGHGLGIFKSRRAKNESCYFF